MGKLFAVVLAVITLVATGIFAAHVWWLPPDISAHGAGIDRQLDQTMLSAGGLFVLAQLALAALVWRSGGAGGRAVANFPGGATPMVVAAIVIVGAEILTLTFVGSKVWAAIYEQPAPENALRVDVLGEQFAFYFRYAGTDGRFGVVHPERMNDATGNFFGLDPEHDTTARDDIVVPTLTIPVDRPIAVMLRAKDVGHAFYVPALRIQQDFLPGLVIPLHFTATRTGKFELVCTQLCGLGHYDMRAYVQVVSPEDFDRWQQQQEALLQ